MKREKRDESAPLPSLPCDLIFNILLGLPVKSILRFKCVCKSWLTLFTDPDSVKKHLSRSQTSKLIVSCRSSTSCPTLLVVPTCGTDGENRDPRPIHHIETRGRKFNILGSCDGLVLYGTGPNPDRRYSNRLYLLNPSTGKHLSIENITDSESNSDSASYGFGYDESIDDFKVVAISPSSYKL
ncbi:F-box/kelch-repeat protein At3g23880-like [Cornus florida]|uniref:F-box/kelch-repeat protein At3g23880-like n=1 Tax=Cornus florida TaxID=4283 RepID=UPI0028A2D15F|nr:F-box/kelch-repeat protein At3g23880-like [Cornus florida]